MIYKFRSKATGDVIMLGPQGDQLMRLLGREPAPKGIFEPAAMPGVIARLEAAIAAENVSSPPADEEAEAAAEKHVSLRQRAWPLVDMLRRAHAADVPVVWGV